MTAPISDKTAIAGIGWTAFTKNSGTSALNLAGEACLMALADAGVSAKDVDGVMAYEFGAGDSPKPFDVAEALGLKNCNFDLFSPAGGTWACGPVGLAAMAVFAGVCRNVLVYRATNGRSGQRRSTRETSGASQFLTPFGVIHAATNFGHHATAHMARYGTTTLDFAHLAVTQRKHAMLNKKAMMRTPITIEEHQASRWLVYPFRLLDFCLQTDGAVALLVTSAERARDMKQAPVYISAMLGGKTEPDNFWETNGTKATPNLYAQAGLTPKDVDVAEIYDPFTFMCMTHIEDFGLVPKGEIGAWVREGRNGLDGDIPVNTHGGLLSEAYMQGLGHVIEAVQQLRPGGVVDDLCVGAHTFDRATCRQVRNPQIGLVCGESGASSLLLRRA